MLRNCKMKTMCSSKIFYLIDFKCRIFHIDLCIQKPVRFVQYSTVQKHKIFMDSSLHRRQEVKLKIKPYEELLKVLETRERNLVSQNVLGSVELLEDARNENDAGMLTNERSFKTQSPDLYVNEGPLSVKYTIPHPQRKSTSKQSEKKQEKTSKKNSKSKLNSKSVSNLDEIEKNTKYEYAMRTLKSYMEISINGNEVEKAHVALEKFMMIFQRKNKTKVPVDISAFDLLISGWARKGQLDKVKQIFARMSELGITPSLQSYAGYLESIARSKFLDISEVKHIVNDMKSRGLSPHDILLNCTFVVDQREKVLEALGFIGCTVSAAPTDVHEPYTCSLLRKLNKKSYGRGGRHFDACFSKENIPILAASQMEIENKFILEIKSVYAADEIDDKTLKSRNYLKECEDMWREKLRADLKKTQIYENKSFGLHKVTIYPYLSVINTETLIDLLLQEVRSLAETGEYFNLNEKVIYYNLGTKVMRHYYIWLNQKNQITSKTLNIYQKYLEYILDPELSCKYLPREYWEYLKQEHSNGPTIGCFNNVWPHDILIQIGKYLYGILLNNISFNPNIVRHKSPSKIMAQGLYLDYLENGVKLSKIICAHSLLCKLYQDAKLENLVFDATLVPMVCPPVPWVKHDFGGLLITRTPFIRFPDHAVHQAIRFSQVPSTQLNPIFDSLNSLSLCPWIINKPLLDLIIDVFRKGGSEELDIPLNPSSFTLPSKINSSMTAKEKAIRYKQEKEIIKMKNEMSSLWYDCLYKLSIANHFRDQVFWFPHNLDFRGRVYPTPPHFNHLGSDMARSILLFAEGQPLGPKGLDWLKIHLINLTGFKKREPNAERLKFADEMIPLILDSADHPFEGEQWWRTSDKPWQTLACCKEIANAIRHGNPAEYISHFPIHQDGSCNGLQHYAALGRDELGAIEVNLHPADTPQDVYSGVAALVEKERQKDANKGVEVAKVLEGFVKRKVVKQTVMTFVYGVTAYGAKLQILKQLKDMPEFPEKYHHEAAVYLMKKTFFSIREMFTATKQIQDWLTECAEQITRVSGLTLEWVTPLGLPVIQPYHKEIAVKNTSNYISQAVEPNLSYKSKYEPYQLPNVRKQKNAFAPNFIHSLDSTHMMLTSLFCQRKGITFVSVHDCYWTHPSTVEIMNMICRKQFISLHNEPILEDLSAFFLDKYARVVDENIQVSKSKKKAAGIKLKDVLSRVPEKGTFQLEKVMDSTYFFS